MKLFSEKHMTEEGDIYRLGQFLARKERKEMFKNKIKTAFFILDSKFDLKNRASKLIDIDLKNFLTDEEKNFFAEQIGDYYNEGDPVFWFKVSKLFRDFLKDK